jgi:8-oxo-dGTP pyrophosphatase MutT (NUDIX family)
MEFPPNTKVVAAGVLPFFNNRQTILLGKEYRKVFDRYNWMEFGGKREGNETLAEVACREANEETAGTLHITLDQVLEAERQDRYVDFHNPKSGVFYRMYCVDIAGELPTPEVFQANAVGAAHVEMVEWRYFPADAVLHNVDGCLPDTDIKIYDTSCTRLKLLVEKFAAAATTSVVDTA